MIRGSVTLFGFVIAALSAAIAMDLHGSAVNPAGAAEAETQPPIKHPTLVNPAALSGARAESVYRAIREQMRRDYGRSADPLFLAYQSWRRFNRTPYRSGNHGERFVNHYGNRKAAGYGRYERLDTLPAGAIVIKDSFVVTQSGGVMTGPLFMMEKMGEGFDSSAGRWRFLMLRANGSLLGMTGGEGSENVRFCADCHEKAGAEHDYLFFMPREVRRGN